MFIFIPALLFGYAFGSLSFGLLLTRFAGNINLRQVGSGNIGATNVLRTGRKDLAAATLIGDALKATAAILIASLWDQNAAIAAAIGAFIGHLYPVWLQFKGGKGVATFLGCLIGLNFGAALIFALFWLASAYLFKFSSLAALIASATSVLFLVILGENTLAYVFFALCTLLWWRHQDNITRLFNGTESRIGEKTLS